MRTAGLILITICGFVAGRAAASNSESQQAPSYESVSTASDRSRKKASPSKSAKHHVGGTPSGVQTRQRRTPNANPARRHVSGTNSNSPRLSPTGQQHLTTGSARNLNPPRAYISGGIAKKGSTQTKSVSSALAVRPPNLFPSSSPTLDTARCRRPSAAVIGGPGSSRTGGAAVINGSQIKRKP